MVTRRTPANVRKSLLLKGQKAEKKLAAKGKERRKHGASGQAAKIGRITKLRDISVLKLKNQ